MKILKLKSLCLLVVSAFSSGVLAKLEAGAAQATSAGVPVSAEVRKSIEVIYAIVPRSALPKAIVDSAAAMQEEVKITAPGGGGQLIKDFAAVVFITNHSGISPLNGVLRVWMPAIGPVDINVFSISSKAPSVFVVDGGATSDNFFTKVKKTEWVMLNVRP